ncbi:protein of unknown function [Georgfuchsia toluolica]|uniref:Tc1-like transposase DDE domain-containing protein n=1 Tax=Georgfuchsia toluolica TaxID=424218 RepID=A0A916J293_9PROT|nr:transposase [Georgfuchsia toluolica]CAG4883354.1 protein of unknown function [Georgfuchsia toluolica]
MIIWDGLKAHKSRLVREFVELKGDRIVLDYLPRLPAVITSGSLVSMPHWSFIFPLNCFQMP